MVADRRLYRNLNLVKELGEILHNTLMFYNRLKQRPPEYTSFIGARELLPSPKMHPSPTL